MDQLKLHGETLSQKKKSKKKKQDKSIVSVFCLFCLLRQGFFLYVILTVLELGLLVCMGVGTHETVLTDGCRYSSQFFARAATYL